MPAPARGGRPRRGWPRWRPWTRWRRRWRRRARICWSPTARRVPRRCRGTGPMRRPVPGSPAPGWGRRPGRSARPTHWSRCPRSRPGCGTCPYLCPIWTCWRGWLRVRPRRSPPCCARRRCRLRWWRWRARPASRTSPRRWPGSWPPRTRRALRSTHQDCYRERFFSMSVQSHGVFLKGRLDPVAAESLRVALDAMGQHPDQTRTPGQACADALVMLAERVCAGTTSTTARHDQHDPNDRRVRPARPARPALPAPRGLARPGSEPEQIPALTRSGQMNLPASLTTSAQRAGRWWVARWCADRALRDGESPAHLAARDRRDLRASCSPTNKPARLLVHLRARRAARWPRAGRPWSPPPSRTGHRCRCRSWRGACVMRTSPGS